MRMQQSAKHRSFAQCIINSMCFLNQNVHKQVNLTWLPTGKKHIEEVQYPLAKHFWTKLNTVNKWLVKSFTTHNARVNMVIVDNVKTQFLVMEPDFIGWNRYRIQSYLNPNKNTVKTLYSVCNFFSIQRNFKWTIEYH